MHKEFKFWSGTRLMQWNIVIINFCLHLCSTLMCSWGAPVHTGTEEGALELLTACPGQQAQTWERPGVMMATAPRTHQWCGFTALGWFLPKGNSYKSIVFITTIVQISLLTAEAEMSLVGMQSCWVPRSAQALQRQAYSCCTQLQHVFPSDGAVFGLCYHSWHFNVIFLSNKTQLKCENSLLFLSWERKAEVSAHHLRGKTWGKTAQTLHKSFKEKLQLSLIPFKINTHTLHMLSHKVPN